MTGLADARNKFPSLSSLDDAQLVDAVHLLYYPGMDKATLSAKLGYSPPEAAPVAAGVLRTAGDVGIKMAQGAVDLGAGVVGLGSLATGGMVGKGARAIGFDPKRTNEVIGEYLSDSQKRSDEKVAGADGFVDTIAESVQNPRAILGSIAQSAPGMIAGMGVTGAVARGIAAKAALATTEGAAASAAQLAAGKTAAQATEAALATRAGAKASAAAIEAAGTRLVALGAATEGAQSAGHIADSAQAAGREYGDYALPAVAAGVGTAAIGLGAGKLMGDSATAIATGARSAGATGNIAARAGKQFVSEGVLEEMPQSAQEQYFTNVAQGEEDRMKGVANAAGTGLVTGGVMGVGMGALQGGPAPVVPVVVPASGPLAAAANAGQTALANRANAAAAAAAGQPADLTAAPAGPRPLAEIDARLEQLYAVGRGSKATDTTPAVAARRYTPEEEAEFRTLAQERQARTDIPADQIEAYRDLIAQEAAEKTAAAREAQQPAIEAAARIQEAAAAQESARKQALEDAELVRLLEEDQKAEQARKLAASEQNWNKTAEEMAVTNAIVEHDRIERAAANRATLRDGILNDSKIPTTSKKSALEEALQRDGYINPTLTDEDHAAIDRATVPVRTAPNELINAVPERKEPAPAPTAVNTRSVDDAIAAGMRLKSANGAILHKPGSTKVFKLSTAQKAYYQKAIARLDQLQAEPAAAEQGDTLYDDARTFVRGSNSASAMALQQHLKVGYNRAQRLLEQMEREGIVSPMESNGARQVVAVPAPLSEFDAAAHEAATSPQNDRTEPTESEKEAGNYKVGKPPKALSFGLPLSIENPEGSVRKGVDKSGTPWETTMQHHYGYIRGTVGADKDHIDVFVGKNLDTDKVFVVDQVHPESGKFDEHKVMLGFDSLDDARAAYRANYAADWTGGKRIGETTVDGFKNWLSNGQTRKEYSHSSQNGAVQFADVIPLPAKTPAEIDAFARSRAQAPAELLAKAKDDTRAYMDWYLGDHPGATAPMTGLYQGRTFMFDAAPFAKVGEVMVGNRKDLIFKYGTMWADAKRAQALALAPAPVQKLTKQDLNKMTVKDMSDAQLLQARDVFADGQRAPKIEKEITARGIGAPATAEVDADINPATGEPYQFPMGIYGTVDQPLRFISGMSAPADFAAAFAADKHVGISINALSTVSIPKIAQAMAASNGSYLFIDSGAFSIFRANQRAKAARVELFDDFEEKGLDFDAILEKYEALHMAIAKADQTGYTAERVFFVMPDIVGDQAGSLELVGKYADQINMGGRNIVPLQGGELTLKQAYETMMRNLGMDPARDISPLIGIPSKAAAVSNEQLQELVEAYGDSIWGIHILGAVADKTLNPRLEVLRAAGYADGNVSADANRLRSLMWGGTPRAEAMRALLHGDGLTMSMKEAVMARKAAAAEESNDIDDDTALPAGTAPEHARMSANGPQSAQFTSDEFKAAAAQVRAANAQWDEFVGQYATELVGKNKKRKPRKDAPAEVHTAFDAYTTARDAARDAYGKALVKPKWGVATGLPVLGEAPIDESIVPMTMDAASFKAITDEWAMLFADPAKEERVRMGSKVGAELLTPAQARARIENWKERVRKQGEEHGAENSQKTVLSLFDLTGEWSRPWREAGYNVVQFDIQSGQDVFDFSVEYFTENYDLTDVYAILAATPCTDYASSGAKHFLAKDEAGQTEQSVELVEQTARTIEYFRPAVWALENPVGRIQNLTGLPDPRLSFDPNHFGDPYTKKTMIWGSFNADLPSANVEATLGSKMHSQYGGKSQATKNARSETPEGFAYAFFLANNYIDIPAERKLAADYPEASGAVLEALNAGVSETRIHELMQDTYGNYEYEDARNALVQEVADKLAPAPGPTKPKRSGKEAAATPAADLPAPSNEQAPAGDKFANNKIFTADAAAKARALLRSKLGQLNSGIDPEMMQAGIMLAGAHIEAGARSFIAFSKAMVEDIGENIRPYLRSFYEGVRHYPGIDGKDMTLGADIDAQQEVDASPVPAAIAKVVGKSPKVAKKSKAEPGNAALRLDYGIEHIDGYATSDEFPAGPAGDYPSGGIKAAFLKDAQRYLKDVSVVLMDHGFAPAKSRDGKPMKPVRTNEAGPAVPGDVTLTMFNDEAGQGIYIDVGASALRGIVPTSNSGLSVRVRVTDAGDPFGGRENQWMDPGLTARDLAGHIVRSVDSVATRSKSATLNTNASTKEDNGQIDTGRESAEALGRMAPAEDGGAESVGRVERSDDGSSDRGAAADLGSDEPRVPSPRGGRGRTGGAHPADAGSAGGGRLGGARAGRNGKRVSGPDARASLNSDVSTPPAAPNLPAENFRITEDVRLGQGGEVEKFNDNLAAIRTMRAIEADNRRATPGEQAVLARYVGWGGLANAFPSPETGQFKDAWRNRGPELAELLSPKEYALARRSTLDSHYTSKIVVDGMWVGARRLGFKGGMALESSMGAGNFLGLMPREVAGNTKFVGVEYDNLTARIATLLYPRETVLNSGFQDVPLSDGAFDLAIGNPPFGEQSLRFQFKPEINGHSIHNQFFLASLDALKPGGLQVQVVSRYLLDKMDKSSRVMLAKKANLLGAIRLPDTAFKENARTSVVTDIVFLQRLTPAEEANMAAVFAAAAQKPGKNAKDEQERSALAAQVPEWVNTTTIADPLGGEPMPINSYFARNPGMIMGVQERSGSMAHGNDITVRLDQAELAGKLASAIAALPQNAMEQDQSAIDLAIARHKDMSDALRIALAGHENGSIKLEAGGVLEQVTERETPEGSFELTRRTLSAASPWSDALYMNSAGQWYTIVAQLDEQGKSVKAIKDGRATKLNVYDRKVFASEADIPTGMLLGQSRYERLKLLVGLRDMLKEQLSMEAENAPSAAIEANRGAMAAAYQAFVKAHGLISEPANSSLMGNMPDGALVQALEFGYRPAISAARAARIKEKVRPSSATPAPILSRRVILPREAATTAASLADAIAINTAESGRVDIERIASLLGQTVEQIEQEISAAERPLLFKDPESHQWETRNDYLSGQVKRKLNAARAARMTGNVIALEEVQPEPWGAENVTALLGSSWVPPAVYADFVQHISGSAIARVSYSPATNSYSVTGAASNRANEEEWASPGYTTIGLISDLLNNHQIKVMEYSNDRTQSQVHQEHTALALLKAKAIATEFTDWVYKDGARRNQLVEIFNEKFNTRVNRQHDGSHLILPGKVPDEVIGMRRHQKNTIWRGIAERFMLVDHAVGAGKTFTAIARAMERRRMGLSKKPAIIVPNHMVDQFTSDVYRLYPGAKVLAAGKKDFEKSRRRKLFAKIATGDFDIVIIPHSSFGFIGIAPETEERYLQVELDAALQAVADAEDEALAEGATSFRKPFGVKEAERLVDKITARMEKVAGDKSKDRLLTFEQMGIDDLTVDEAHEFKNLFYSSRLTGVKGMGNKTGSQKAFDLYNKVRVLRESPTGAVTFMTGTPISNSAVEMYNMMRYLAADELRELGLEHFDAWRAQFVSTDAGWEPTETGRLKEVNRLGRTWSNMRSLMDLYYSFTDSVDNDDIKKAYAEDNNGEQFPIPRVTGGDRQSVVIEPTKAQLGLLADVLQGFDQLPTITDPYERNIARLRLMDRARKVSLDVRAAEPSSKSDEKGGKLDVLADNVKRIYDKWDSDRGTQLVFLDRSVPKSKGDDTVLKEFDALQASLRKAFEAGDENEQRRVGEKLERFDSNEIEAMRNAQAGGWNAYQQIKDNLIARGIPAAEIRFVQEANNDAQKQAMFDAVNDGTVRVLIGSTPRMGAGTNVQQRLVGLHHADVTWKPSDIEQREGRIIRQGNKLLDKYGIDRFEVEILAYATERTIDAKMWSLNASKLKTINAIRKYDGAFSMDFEDEDSVSMAELAALASGDPLLLERVKLMSEIDKLELLKRLHSRKEWGITGQIEDAENAINTYPARIAASDADLTAIKAGIEAMEQDAAGRSVRVEGTTYTDGTKARTAVYEAVKAQQGGDDKKKVSISVDGRRLTSLEGAMAAVGSVIGDQQTFLMTIGGKDLIARTDAARAAAQIATEQSEDLDPRQSVTVDIGTYRGLALQATMERDARDTYTMSLVVLRADGSTLATGDTKPRDNPDYSTSGMRTAVEDLEKTLDPQGLEWTIGNLQRRIVAAREALPGLRAKKGGPFAQQDELDAKQARLEAVIRELSSGPVTAARAIALRTNPLLNVDGSYVRQSPALAFSRTRIDTDDQLVNVFSQIAQDDHTFRLPDSDGKTLDAVMADMAPSLTVAEFFGGGVAEDPVLPVDRVWTISAPDGGQAWVYRNNKNKEVWLDISNWKEGHLGAQVYQAVATFTHNTGHTFIGDPQGLSDKALYRRTEHMISSALRHGTTDHLAPHERQRNDLANTAGTPMRPIQWRDGEHAHNLREMLVSSYTNILQVFPEINDVQYNFARARFERISPVRASADPLWADGATAGEHADRQGAGSEGPGSAVGRGSGGADEGAGQLGRVDAVAFTDADFETVAESVRVAYDVLFPSARGAFTPPIGVSDLKRAALVGTVLRGEGSAGGRAALDLVSDRLLQRLSPQLKKLLYSRDAEYFRDDGNHFLPAIPAGVDAGAAAPVELTGAELLAAKKSTEQLNRQLVKAGMEPVRALRLAPNAHFALARQIGETLGIKVNFVSKSADFEGVAYNGIAYIADGMRNPALAIAGHETLHALEQSNPQLGAKLRTQIRAYLKDGVVEDRQAREYAANGLQDVSEEQAEAEVIADINGAMWMDPVFWADLAKVDRSLFRSVAYKFMELAAKAIKSLRGSRFDVTALVRDVEAVRAIMVSTWAENNGQRDAAAPAQMVQRSTAASSVELPVAHRLTHEAIAKEVDNRIGQFAHQPTIRIRDSAFGVLPGVARDERVSGAVYEDVIYLFRDALPDLREVQRTLFHELLHYGLQRYLPKDQYITRMTTLYQRDAYFRSEADRWAKGEQGQMAAAEGGAQYAIARGVDEALAQLAEPNAGVYIKNGLRDRAERTVQRWLANLAQFFGMTEAAAYWRGIKNEEARMLIQQIFKRAERGLPPADPWAIGAGPSLRTGARAGSAAAGPSRSAAFKAWFSDSQVVAAGEPLVVYHGTRSAIAGGFTPGDADHSAGIFFTSSPGIAGSVYAADEGTVNLDKLKQKLEAMGFDQSEPTDEQFDAAWSLADQIRKRNRAFGWEPESAGQSLATQIVTYLADKAQSGNPDVARTAGDVLGVKVTAPADGANIVPVYLSIQDPLVVDGTGLSFDSDEQEGWIARAKAEGKDGVIIRNYDDGGFGGFENYQSAGRHTVFIAFTPEQVKSATGNNGDFDPSNPDIAFSRAGLGDVLAGAAGSIADVRLPANYLVGDLFNSSGKVNWWHKTIGTMDNLAKRAPAFGKMYEAVQRFLGDVSRYAVVAADLAPTLLPKLENIADVVGKKRKKPLTAADTKAIGAPIFEGTLVWARDAHGKPVKLAELEAQAEQLTTAQKARILIEKGVIDDEQNRAWLNNPLDFYDSVINGKFEATQLKAGVVWSNDELSSIFALNDAQIALYREFRAAIDKSLTNLTISEMVKLGGKDAKGMIEQAVAAPDLAAAADLLRDHFIALAQMHPEQADMHLDTAKQILDLGDKGGDLMERGYAPLSRFGKYTVYVQQDNEQVYFGMFESQYEASKMARDMRAEHPDAQVSHGTVSEDAYKLFAGVSPETIELFGSMVGLDSQADAASTEVYQAYLKLAKNNRSSMKRLIQRKGIAGFSEDAGRVLAGFIYSNARLTAGNAHLGEIDEAVTAIPKQQGELTDAAMQLREHIRNPEGGGSTLGGLMFAQFLGGSVASAMVNLTQPFTMTLPYLSQWGGIGKAGKRLAAAVRDAAKDATGDDRLDAALKWATEEGIVAPQEVHYLQAQAGGKGALRAGDGTRAGNARAHLNNTMTKVSLGWGKLFAMAELSNRRITFIAAYRTAVEEGHADPARFAQQAVAQTQGTYNSGNKPKWARGTVGSLLLTFKQFSIGYLELLSRMMYAGAPGSKERTAGRRGALYMVAVLFLMSGADGLPFEQDLEDALDGILQRLGYNFSSKRAKQAFLTDLLGQGGADFALKGISSMPGMPVDVSGRFGMGNLIPGTGLLTKKDSYTRDLGELAGPAGDLAKRAFTGAGKALGGDLVGAALDLSPVAVRNVAKGVDMVDAGAYRDTRGYIVNPTSSAEAVMKMVGFQPNSTADIQEQKGQALNMIGQNRLRSTEIAEHWANGLANGDAAMVQEAREWRDDWNGKNPETPIKVNMPAVIRRVRAMKQDAITRTQKTAPAALKQTVRNELASTRE